MIHLLIRIVGTEIASGRESILAQVETDRYDPDHLEEQIAIAIDRAVTSLGSADEKILRPWKPEVSISLSADDEEVRPSLHLTTSLLLRLARAEASFDFDPYV